MRPVEKNLLLVLSHFGAVALGFALGIYMLPVLMAPDPPSQEFVAEAEQSAVYSGVFRRDLEDSDFLHWGEGVVYLSPSMVSFQGELAPGPDYRLYLSPRFVQTEADFEVLQSEMVEIGNVDTFQRFVLTVPRGVDLNAYNSVIVWCKAFGQFITAAQYR
ncbi:MAG: DM13 domain-containing protein [Halioglobus sp.]|nr:DM13 domain-containing protein [Halioglobus sp.]